MSKSKIDDLLKAYLDGKLTPDERIKCSAQILEALEGKNFLVSKEPDPKPTRQVKTISLTNPKVTVDANIKVTKIPNGVFIMTNKNTNIKKKIKINTATNGALEGKRILYIYDEKAKYQTRGIAFIVDDKICAWKSASSTDRAIIKCFESLILLPDTSPYLNVKMALNCIGRNCIKCNKKLIDDIPNKVKCNVCKYDDAHIKYG